MADSKHEDKGKVVESAGSIGGQQASGPSAARPLTLTFMRADDSHPAGFPADFPNELLGLVVSFLPIGDEIELRRTSRWFYQNVTVRKPAGKEQLLIAENCKYAMRRNLWACFFCEQMLSPGAFVELKLTDDYMRLRGQVIYSAWHLPGEHVGGVLAPHFRDKPALFAGEQPKGKALPDHFRLSRYCRVCEAILRWEKAEVSRRGNPRANVHDVRHSFDVHGKVVVTCSCCGWEKQHFADGYCETCHVEHSMMEQALINQWDGNKDLSRFGPVDMSFHGSVLSQLSHEDLLDL